MSLLFRLVFATACRSTHHKLAMDALRLLRGEQAERRRMLFLKFHEAYLTGAKAPDDTFKDFKNHVLHVSENFWGGAIVATQKWYDTFVTALRNSQWEDAAYAAGVASHYYSDPLMPFHTGQTEEEGKVHRAAEWSIACGYGELQNIIERDLGYPQFEAPRGPSWLGDMVRAGATYSHPHYHALIDHYDLSLGVVNPVRGMDQEFKDRIAACLAFATVGIAKIVERGFEESSASLPEFSLSMEAVVAAIRAPIRTVLAKIADARERAAIEAMVAEIKRTGKVVEALPEDDKQVRRMHAEEVLKTPLAELDAKPARATGQAYGDGAAPRFRSSRVSAAPVRPPQGPSPIARDRSKLPKPQVVVIPETPPETPRGRKAKGEGRVAKPRLAKATERSARFHLQPDCPVKDAPSISVAASKKFEGIGIRTIGEFASADAEDMAAKLADRRFSASALQSIQQQVRLMCRIPGLRGHDAQILFASGVRDGEAIASMTPQELMAKITPFLATAEATRILRTSPKPDEAEAAEWIRNAQIQQALPKAA
jgi:hypothetical protein